MLTTITTHDMVREYTELYLSCVLEPKNTGEQPRKEVVSRKDFLLKELKAKGYDVLKLNDELKIQLAFADPFEELIVMSDGNVRNNHSLTRERKAGVSVVVYGDNELVYTQSRYLGSTVQYPSRELVYVSSLSAEYQAFLDALNLIIQAKPKAKRVRFFADSNDMVKHVTQDLPNDPMNRDFVLLLRKRLAAIDGSSLQHIPRKYNHFADELARNAIDRKERN